MLPNAPHIQKEDQGIPLDNSKPEHATSTNSLHTKLHNVSPNNFHFVFS